MINLTNIEERYRWAKLRRNSLSRSLDLYKKRHPLILKAKVSDDRMSWDLEIVIDKDPPLLKWALWHAGIVHDIRSILDNLVWELAHDGAAPSFPSRIAFPVIIEETKWAKEGLSRIGELPDIYQTRIENIQPFKCAPNDSVAGALRLVHTLDIQNKHHTPIIIAMSNQREIINSRRIIYKVDPDANDVTQVTLPTFKYENGATIWHETVPKPIEKVVGNFRINAHFVLQDEYNNQYPLIGSLDYMLSGIRDIVNHVTGVNSAQSS